MPYVTNYQESSHNAWTLTKNVAKSLNAAAGKIDAKIYGHKTNVTVIAHQPPKPPKESHPIRDVCMGIGAFVFIVVIFIAYMRGDITKRDIFIP